MKKIKIGERVLLGKEGFEIEAVYKGRIDGLFMDKGENFPHIFLDNEGVWWVFNEQMTSAGFGLPYGASNLLWKQRTPIGHFVVYPQFSGRGSASAFVHFGKKWWKFW